MKENLFFRLDDLAIFWGFDDLGFFLQEMVLRIRTLLIQLIQLMTVVHWSV